MSCSVTGRVPDNRAVVVGPQGAAGPAGTNTVGGSRCRLRGTGASNSSLTTSPNSRGSLPNTSTSQNGPHSSAQGSSLRPKPCCLLWCCCCKCPCSTPGNKSNDDNGPTRNSNNSDAMANCELEPHPSIEEIRDWGRSFDKLMRSAAGRNYFRDFLRGEYSEENIMFWLACEDLKRETNPEIVEERARIIYEDYISILSPKEVSLDARVREIVNRNMVEPTPNMFEEAQIQIYTLMHRDSYPRFVNSPLYRTLSQQQGGSSGPQSGVTTAMITTVSSGDDGKRPDGISLIPWSFGKSVVWDFTCVDTYATTHVNACSKLSCAAATSAEVLKIKKYSCLSDQYLFFPVAIETSGAFGCLGLDFLKDLGKRISKVTFDNRSFSFLLQRISIAVQRGNAASILGTLPSYNPFDEISFLPSNYQNYKISALSSLPEFLKNSKIEEKEKATFKNCPEFDMKNISNVSIATSEHNSKNITISPSNSIPSSPNSVTFSRRSNKRDRKNHRIRDYFDFDSESERTLSNYCLNIRPAGYGSVNFLGLNGLLNIGNTCFMNCVIQCLSNTRWLLEYLRKDTYIRDINTSISSRKGSLIKAFAQVIKELWSEDSSVKVVNPTLLKEQIQCSAPRFINDTQQDAQEFLRYLLEGLHEYGYGEIKTHFIKPF